MREREERNLTGRSSGSVASDPSAAPPPGRAKGGSPMYQWTEEQEMVRTAVRQFIDKEIRPRIDEFEHGDTPPYDVLRKLFKDFGMDAAARDRFAKQIAFETAVSEAVSKGEAAPEKPKRDGD